MAVPKTARIGEEAGFPIGSHWLHWERLSDVDAERITLLVWYEVVGIAFREVATLDCQHWVGLALLDTQSQVPNAVRRSGVVSVPVHRKGG